MTFTRSELLAKRGYPEAIVNGHGHPVEPVTSVEPAPTRTCDVCHQVIEPARVRRYAGTRTCSSECAKTLERQRDRARSRDRRTSSAGAVKLTRATNDNGTISVYPRMASFIKELAREGMTVVIEGDGLRVHVTSEPTR